MNTEMFVDMDGTLVDHIAGACEWTGKTEEELIVPGQWEVPEVDWAALPLTFWSTLPKTREFQHLCELMCAEKMLHRKVFLITTVVSDDCYAGKRMWIERYLPSMRSHLITVEDKSICSAPGRVLYDDKDQNITDWEKAGGIGRLIPRRWNSGHLTLQSLSRSTS